MPYKILMVFGLFLLGTVIAYAVTPKKYRHITLLLASLIAFYSVSGFGVLFLLTTALTTYAAGILMEKITENHPTKGLEKPERKRIKALVKRKKKWVAFFYVLLNLGILLLLKYFNFFSSVFTKWTGITAANGEPFLLKIAVPLGLSYYTLQALSYVIDVFRGKYKAEKNVLKLSLFVTFFPQLHEGPFGRYDALMPQLCKNERVTAENLLEGGRIILWGLFKIFMIANRAAMLSDAVFGGYEKYGGFTILLGAVAFTLQLYAEFSGYIDVARGVSKMFGIELAENFDMPFISQNVAEFWRRWHISLGAFFRDYVFYPVSTAKWMRKLSKKLPSKISDFVTVTLSLLTVWFLTGLWHGASEKYILYGLYYFVLIVLFNLLSPFVEKALEKKNIKSENPVLKTLRIVKTLLFVLVGMMLFRAESVSVFFHMMGAIFTSGEPFSMLEVMELPDVVVLVLSVLVLLCSAVLKLCHVNLAEKYAKLPGYQRYLVCFSVFCIVTVFGAYGLDYLPPDPIYGGF